MYDRHVDTMRHVFGLDQAPDERGYASPPTMRLPAAGDPYSLPGTVGRSPNPHFEPPLFPPRPCSVPSEYASTEVFGAPERENTPLAHDGPPPGQSSYGLIVEGLASVPACHTQSSQGGGFFVRPAAPGQYETSLSEDFDDKHHERSQMSTGPELTLFTAAESLLPTATINASAYHPRQTPFWFGEAQSELNQAAGIVSHLAYTPPSQTHPATYTYQTNTLNTPNTSNITMKSPISDDEATMLVSTHPDWRLTPGIYEWLFAVMHPKRRPNKRVPTPTGPCLLCGSICKRPGILQQHLTVIHRQRLSRKHLARQSFNVELALAFVVAELSSGANVENDSVLQECRSFFGALKSGPTGLEPVEADAYLLLRQKFDEYCQLQSWVGVQCEACGMWATRPAALEEHRLICVGAGQTEHTSGPSDEATNPHQPLRLTASGLAARPMRGNIHGP